MRLSVLDLTAEMPDLFAGLPRASRQIIDWLSPAIPEAEFSAHDISGGAALPEFGMFDGIILSGSEFGVYDHPDWMPRLRDFLRDLRAADVPTFGICFGHQIMAETWGGRAELARGGKAVGVRKFLVQGEVVNAYVWHQDQVTEMPPKAQVLGEAPYCLYGVIEYPFAAMSVQFHPEFTDTQLRAMFDRGRDQIITGAEVDEALRSFEGNAVSPALMRRETAAFFRKFLPKV